MKSLQNEKKNWSEIISIYIEETHVRPKSNVILLDQVTWTEIPESGISYEDKQTDQIKKQLKIP